jgi:DNA-binding transcriptional MocR family regulator
MAPLDPLTHDRVYRALKDDILSGRIGPAGRLTAAQIARDYQASMTPVREAIYRLVGEGIVIMKEGGFFTTPLDPQMLADILDISQKLLVIGLNRWNDGTLSSSVVLPVDALCAADCVQLIEEVFQHLFDQTDNQAISNWGRAANERLHSLRIADCEAHRRARLECKTMFNHALQRDRTRLGRQILAHHRRLFRYLAAI